MTSRFFMPLIIVVMLMLAQNSFALTNGPTDPEFSSYEPVEATDLVNLPTGDFSYVMPLGDVKTPDGTNFPVVMSYHAGILNDQEATWVGLGWTLNVGAINRQVRGTPDDYNGAVTTCFMYNPGESGWTFDVGGGWGPISATVGFSGKANGGIQFEGLTSAGIGWGVGIASVGVNFAKSNISAGVNLGVNGVGSVGFGVASSGGKISGSFNESINGVAQFSLSSGGHASMSYTSMGISAVSMSMSKAGMHQSSSAFNFSIPLPGLFSLNLGFSKWSWYYSLLSNEVSYGYLFQSNTVTRYVGTDNQLVVDAMNIAAPDQQDRWRYSSRSAAYTINQRPGRFEKSALGQEFYQPSQDIYAVTGQGMSGQFMPFAQTPSEACFSDDQNYDGIIGIPDQTSAPFSSYSTHFNTAPLAYTQDFKDGMVFKMMDETSLNCIDNLDPTKYAYLGSDYYKNIGQTANTADPVTVTGRRITPLFNSNDIIMGFVITDQEGKNFYYTCPVYSYDQTSYVTKKPEVPQLLLSGSRDKASAEISLRRMETPYATAWLLTAITGPDYVRRSDFVSNINDPTNPNPSPTVIEENLMPQQGDWGYWVRFRYEYGLPVVEDDKTHMPKISDRKIVTSGETTTLFPIDKAAYMWRMPFFDSNWPKSVDKPCLKDESDPKNPQYSSMFGIRDNTYLKSIETASEVAFFRTSERLDGFGIDEQSFPAFRQNIVKETPTIVNLQKSDKTLDKIAPTVADIDPGNNKTLQDQLALCLKITIPNKYLTTDAFYGLDNGEVVLTLPLTKDVKFQWRGGKTVGSGFLKVLQNINIIKDVSGCYDGDGNLVRLTSSSGEMNQETAAICGTDSKQAKCFYATTNGNNIVLYVIGYSSGQTGTTVAINTNVSFDRLAFWNTNLYTVINPNSGNGDAEVSGTITLGNNVDPYIDGSKLNRYVKKLDEIAWYSKAANPYLNGITDPQESILKYSNLEAITKMPYPQSYRRIKMRYNYELAQGTPNSKSNGVMVRSDNTLDYKGGRLTL
ncbi:MAG: hypothetical protein PHC61_01690, partial [Chitinivibrionales bacterium]|nr:hypothetical protein [Chitinivibrionales bacterium]